MLDLWKSWSTPVEPFPWRTVKIVNSYSEMANKNPLDDSRHAKTSEVTVSKFYRLPESQSGPQKFKKSLEVPICWLLIWSREPPRDWRFQVSTAVRKIYMSPWSLFVWSCLIFAHSLGYHWEGNGFCPLRSPIEYHLLGGSTCSIILVIITQTPEITWVMTCNDHDVIPSLSYLGSVWKQNVASWETKCMLLSRQLRVKQKAWKRLTWVLSNKPFGWLASYGSCTIH